MTVLANARVVTPRAVLDPGWLRIAGTRIAGVGRGAPPAGDEVLDLDGCYVLPGFVDLHMHGGGGAQVTTDDPAEIERAVAFHRRHGTTRTQARTAFAEGARLATHLFNAMGPFHHRDPGPAGAALADDTVTCELINDGVHVHEDAVRIAVTAAGPDRIAFVTDATPAAGMSSGEYRLGPVPVFAEGATVRLADGTLAGSTLTMDQAVRHAVRHVGLTLVEAALAAATTPARLLGLPTGSLQPGLDADLVVLDSALQVRAVFVAGTAVHSAPVSGPW